MISNTVAQRTREIGIRLALGASFRQVIGMVLAWARSWSRPAWSIGLIGSLASVRVLSGLVHNISTFDPYSFLAVPFFCSPPDSSPASGRPAGLRESIQSPRFETNKRGHFFCTLSYSAISCLAIFSATSALAP